MGDERGRLFAGEMALVPATVPLTLRNAGDETIRAVDFFSSNTPASRFDRQLMPFGIQVAGTLPIVK